jgi:hypothetical protein
MKLILHKDPNVESINERRLLEDLSLSYEERMQKLIKLIKLSLLLKTGPIKKNEGKGIVLKYR